MAVTDLECLADFLFRISVLHFPGHHGKELYNRTFSSNIPRIISASSLTGKIDRAIIVSIDFVDHILKFRFGRVLA